MRDAPPHQSQPEVVIIGAGPVGLTAAVVLLRSGIPVRIVDAGDGPTTESRALVVHARTLELWHKLGLAAEAVADGQQMRQVSIMVNGAARRRPLLDIARGARGQTPYPMSLVFEQSKTEALLLRAVAAAGGTVEWNTAATQVDQDADSVSVALQPPGGGEETACGHYVIAADGARSTVREHLGLQFDGTTYEQRFFLADVDMRWDHGHDQFWIDLVDSGAFSFFPMKGSTENRFRIIGGLTPALAARAESSSLTVDDVQETLSTQGGVAATLSDARWIAVYKLHSRRVKKFRVGRVFLAGDSAHVHSPVGGQGMNLGVQDAYNLAWKLAHVLRGSAGPELLDSYEAERIPVVQNVLDSTDRGFRFQTGPGRLRGWLRVHAVPQATFVAGPAARPLFSLISQLWVSYRNSPAVSDDHPRGPLRAGDRLPWARLKDGRDLFDLTRGLGYHLLVLPARDPNAHAASQQLIDHAGAAAADAVADVSVHVIGPAETEARQRYRVSRDEAALILVRPDGHIALRSTRADITTVLRHLRTKQTATMSTYETGQP